MDYIKLGKTDIEVSRLCFGALVIGPLQVNLSVGEGADVIYRGLELGINFIDTAEIYSTYNHIKEAVKRWGKKPVIATKSYAYTKEGAALSLEKARHELDIDIIDIFLLHEQESRLTLKGHREALEYFISQKQKGIIKAVGVSTHNIEVVEACAEMPEIDVIHPLINISGIGIGDGTAKEMENAIKKAYNAGKGIYSMKPLGGGNLLSKFDESMKYILNMPYIHSVAVGMQTTAEVEMNAAIFEGREVPLTLKNEVLKKQKKLHVDYWCTGCGNCVKRCRQNALEVINGRAVVKEEKCVLCGYCAGVCPQFAIKIC